MSALNYIPVDANPIFFTQDFRDVLETYLPALRVSQRTNSIYVSPHDTIKFRFDLDGYLISRSIAPYLHWIIARVNGMSCSQDFGPDYEQLLIPDLVELDQIRQIYATSRG